MKLIKIMVNNEYVQLAISIILLFIGLNEVSNDITSGELNFNHLHGIGIYGIFLFIDALYTVMEGVLGIYDGRRLIVKKIK